LLGFQYDLPISFGQGIAINTIGYTTYNASFFTFKGNTNTLSILVFISFALQLDFKQFRWILGTAASIHQNNS